MLIKVSGLQPIQVTSIADFAPTGAAEVTTINTVADSSGSLAGTFYTLNSANDVTEYYVYHSIDAVAEVFTIQHVADVNGSLNGQYYYIYDGNNDQYHVWFNTATAEVTTVTAEADTEGSLAGKYFRLFAQSGTEYYAYFSFAAVAEVSTITVEADSTNSLDGKYWQFDDGTNLYHVWYNTSGGSAVDPNPGSGSLPIEVAINTNELIADVATATRAAITASAALVTESGTGNDVVITNNNAGFVADTANGDTPGHVFSTDTEGSAATTDPAPDGILVSPPTGIAITITTEDTANAVATAARSAIDAVSDFSTSGATDQIIITDANVGAVRNAEDGDTTWTIATTTAGVTGASDPANDTFSQIPSTSTGVEVAISANATANTIAAAVEPVIHALSEFSASSATDTVTITNATAGACTNASDGEKATGITPAVTTEGRTLTPDPVTNSTYRNDLLGKTAIPVTITVDQSANDIATTSRSAIGAKADFGTGGSTNAIVITNAANGDTTDAADGANATGFTFAETTPGATAIPTNLKMYKIVGTVRSREERWNGNTLEETPGVKNAVTVIVPEKRIEYLVEGNL